MSVALGQHLQRIFWILILGNAICQHPGVLPGLERLGLRLRQLSRQDLVRKPGCRLCSSTWWTKGNDRRRSVYESCTVGRQTGHDPGGLLLSDCVTHPESRSGKLQCLQRPQESASALAGPRDLRTTHPTLHPEGRARGGGGRWFNNLSTRQSTSRFYEPISPKIF